MSYLDEQIPWVEREIEYLEADFLRNTTEDIRILKGILESLNRLKGLDEMF